MTEQLTNEAVRNMIRPWMTGNDEADAKMLSRMFRGMGLTRSQWRQVVSECKAN